MSKTKKYNYLNLRDKSNILKFFSLLEKLSIKHPYLVILILHEYYRSLYSLDPYIKFKDLDHFKRQLIQFGFDYLSVKEMGKFTQIKADKVKDIDLKNNLELKF